MTKSQNRKSDEKSTRGIAVITYLKNAIKLLEDNKVEEAKKLVVAATTIATQGAEFTHNSVSEALAGVLAKYVYLNGRLFKVKDYSINKREISLTLENSEIQDQDLVGQPPDDLDLGDDIVFEDEDDDDYHDDDLPKAKKPYPRRA